MTVVGVPAGTWAVTAGIVNFFFFDATAPAFGTFAALPVPSATTVAFSLGRSP